MPANDIAAWTHELLAQLAQSRQRQLVWLRGPRGWCEESIAELVGAEPQATVFSDAGLTPDAIAPARAAACLGGEAVLVVVDLLDGPDPDLLCIAAGLVSAGGLLLLVGDLETASTGRFAEYLQRELQRDPDIGLVLVPEQSLPMAPGLPRLKPTPIVDNCTDEQRLALDKLDNWLAGKRGGVALISAARGRGKSTCLGLLAARLPACQRVLVTARSRRAAAVLLARAPAVEFIAPDRLLEQAPPADILIVDEAATLPLAMLRQIRRHYPRVIMATTTGGYEGTGGGFRLRFAAELEADRRLTCELRRPVRWCEGDLLEAWLNRCLLLDPPAVDAAAAAGATDYSFYRQADSGLICAAYTLLGEAHYRSRPSDLRRLMDDPGQLLVLARRGETIVGVAWLAEEGGFDAVLSEQVFLGRRRPPGHLLAQMLTAQAGSRGFARFRGLRIQRIAVAASCRRQGIGLGLIECALAHAREQGFDYLGASFAIDPVSAPFWRRAGCRLAHVGFGPGKSSGKHSIAVLRPLVPAVEQALEGLRQRIERDLPLWLTQFLQYLPATDVVALLRLCDFQVDAAAQDAAEIDAFARGNRGFELCFASLQRFVIRRIAASTGSVPELLVSKAVQNRPWKALPRDSEAEGRRQLLARLRREVADWRR